MSHSHKDELYVGPYRLEKTLGKGQTGKDRPAIAVYSITHTFFLIPGQYRTSVFHSQSSSPDATVEGLS